MILMAPEQMAILYSNQKRHRTSVLNNSAWQTHFSSTKVSKVHLLSLLKCVSASQNIVIKLLLQLPSTRSAVLGLSKSSLDLGLRPNSNSAGDNVREAYPVGLSIPSEIR